MKKETLKKNALAHLNKQTTGILILIQNAKEIKKRFIFTLLLSIIYYLLFVNPLQKKIRYIIAVDDEDVRESFLKDVNILMKVSFSFSFIFLKKKQ